MRIIAGTHRGRKIQPPEDMMVRPTADKTRGAIFNILVHASWAPSLFEEHIKVLDVFCGTGAFAFEALSRSAGSATLVDNARASLKLAESNASALKLTSQCQFLLQDAAALLKASAVYDVVFLDPPYRKNLLLPTLENLAEKGWLKAGAVVVAEMARDEEFVPPPHFTLRDSRTYGETKVVFMIYQPS